jgi:hypothetical protein
MKKLSANGQKILKTIHLFTAGSWVTGALTLVLMKFHKQGVTDGGELFGINSTIHFIDNIIVVIIGAVGCLVTGLVYSIFTNWGFFKHNWLIFKWIVTISAILFGTFFLGVWEKNMMSISGAIGSAALTDAAYLYNQKMNFIFGAIQTAILIFTIYVSVFKPWKKK